MSYLFSDKHGGGDSIWPWLVFPRPRNGKLSTGTRWFYTYVADDTYVAMCIEPFKTRSEAFTACQLHRHDFMNRNKVDVKSLYEMDGNVAKLIR